MCGSRSPKFAWSFNLILFMLPSTLFRKIGANWSGAQGQRIAWGGCLSQLCWALCRNIPNMEAFSSVCLYRLASSAWEALGAKLGLIVSRPNWPLRLRSLFTLGKNTLWHWNHLIQCIWRLCWCVRTQVLNRNKVFVSLKFSFTSWGWLKPWFMFGHGFWMVILCLPIFFCSLSWEQTKGCFHGRRISSSSQGLQGNFPIGGNVGIEFWGWRRSVQGDCMGAIAHHVAIHAQRLRITTKHRSCADVRDGWLLGSKEGVVGDKARIMRVPHNGTGIHSLNK